MLRKLYLIGIGPGDPKYLTLEAYEHLQNLNLFFIPEKKGKKEWLTQARILILDYVKKGNPYRLVALPFPERKRGKDYRVCVSAWRTEKANILREAILKEDGEAGLLIWGDPAIYDGHIEVAEMAVAGLPVEFYVVPGISAFQVLSAKHRVSLTELSSPLVFHTPRTLRVCKTIEFNTLVYLDNYETFRRFAEDELYIYWGAYLGTEMETLLAGKLSEALPELIEKRRALRRTFGTIMDTYLLRPKKENP